jgi:hypothetical protein
VLRKDQYNKEKYTEMGARHSTTGQQFLTASEKVWKDE